MLTPTEVLNLQMDDALQRNIDKHLVQTVDIFSNAWASIYPQDVGAPDNRTLFKNLIPYAMNGWEIRDYGFYSAIRSKR